MSGFRTSNGQIYDPSGNVFVARGIDVMNGNGNPSAATLQADFPGINFVRLAIYNYDSPDSLASYVNDLTSHGIVVELENHNNNAGDAGGSQGTIFTGQELQQEQDWYSSVASYFKNNPNVWFGTNNEPSETDPNTGQMNAAMLSDWQKTTYDSVRNTGNNAPVLLEANSWGPGNTFVGYKASDYAGMHNAVWDMHYYGWLSGYSTDQNTVTNTFNSLVNDTHAIGSADGTMPVLIGEYGNSTTGQAIDANGTQTVQAVIDSGLGSAAWAWSQGNPGDGLLNGSGGLSSYGQQVAAGIAKKSATSGSLPPPTTTPGAPPSASGSIVLAGSTGVITDAAGNTWTIKNGAVQINGSNAGYSANVTEIAYVNGTVWQENATNQWWGWSNNGWNTGNGTTTSPLPAAATSPPATTPSANDAIVKAGSTSAIVDATGHKWTITSGGQVAVNGTADATTANVTELAYVNGKVWQENTANNWYSKTAPTDAWSAATTTSPLPGSSTGSNPGNGTSTGGTASPGQWQTASINGMQYMVLLPANYDPSVKYATTLYLHPLDMGNDPTDLVHQVNGWFNTSQFQTDHPSIVVMPLLDQTADPSGQTINFGGVSTADTAGETNAIAALKQVMSKYSVDPSRIYVTGNSMGGIGTEDMMVKFNAQTGTEGHIFAAGLALAGADYGQDPVQMAQILKNVPYMAIHGGQDTQVPLRTDQTVYAAIHAAGGKMIYTQDNSLGHDVWDTYYAQTGANAPLTWLYEQSTGGAAQPGNGTTPPTPTPSANDTVLKAGSTAAITDAAGHQWTISNGTVQMDGAAAGYSANVTEIAYVNGTVWQQNQAGGWWGWSNNGWNTGNGTTTSPLPAAPPATPPDTVVVTAGNTATPVSGPGTVSGDTFSLAPNGVTNATLGSKPTFVQFLGKAGANVTGGSAPAMVQVNDGKNSFTAGSGFMDVTGGAGADAYTFTATSKFLSIEDFSAAKGDTLSIASSLQSGMQTLTDGTNTILAFGNGSAIDLHNVTAVPTIHWN